MSESIIDRIQKALRQEEIHAERIANTARMTFIGIMGIAALFNAPSVSMKVNLFNFTALSFAVLFGLIVYISLKRGRYVPSMKYITTSIDIGLVFLLLLYYANVEIPSVALKNYVFLIIFPLIALTVFRYDPKLTLFAGTLATLFYLLLFFLVLGSLGVESGGYSTELFTIHVTLIGQGTKFLILVSFSILCTYLAYYTRRVIHQTVEREVHLQVSSELVERELQLAAEVQRRFLPSTFPVINNLELFGKVIQGTFVGGDYCDFIQLSDSSVLLIVADVSGKGIPAALIMSEVYAAVHALSTEYASPELLAQKLNTLVHSSTGKKDFVTLVLVEIDSKVNQLCYFNAGHPPPILLVNDKAILLGKGTIPLGVLEELPGKESITVDFPPDSTLLVYTDGVFERMNAAGEQFGIERIQQLLVDRQSTDAVAFVDWIIEQVKLFGDGQALDDDLTLAVVLRKNRV
ncbi:MAG: PP2C family protein-serine/threonine phosphatase [bacterium]